MQDKVAVGEAVQAGYRFGFSSDAVGMAWLPCLLALAVTTAIPLIAFSGMATPASMTLLTPDAAKVANLAMMLMPANVLFNTIFTAMAEVGVLSVALNKREAAGAFFSFGPTVLKLIAAELLVLLATWAFIAVLWAVFIAASYAVGLDLPLPGAPLADWLTFPLRKFFACGVARSLCPATPVLIGLIVFAALEFCALMYVSVRLSFFLPAVVVFENRISIGRAWTLARGQFWRILVVSLGVAIPLMIGVGIIEIFIPKIFANGIAGAGGATGARATILALRGFPAILIALSVLSLIKRVLSVGFDCGAQAHAYLQTTMADAADVF